MVKRSQSNEECKYIYNILDELGHILYTSTLCTLIEGINRYLIITPRAFL